MFIIKIKFYVFKFKELEYFKLCVHSWVQVEL
jgi:hypothetical protein